MTYPMFVDQELPPVRVENNQHLSSASSDRLEKIAQLDKALDRYFAHKTSVNPALSRQVVSYQANKIRPISRWYRFKEAFSDSLVEYLFTAKGINQGPVLDPFAGSGTTLFASSSMGLDSDGIELLPIGQEVIAARQLLQGEHADQCLDAIERWLGSRPCVGSQVIWVIRSFGANSIQADHHYGISMAKPGLSVMFTFMRSQPSTKAAEEPEIAHR
jgi:hypothetical protein